MSVIGIDFGTQNCVISAAQKGGVDVLMNEVSNRQTPNMAGFAEKERQLGEPALTGFARNIKNTVTNVKRLLGRSYREEDFQRELKEIPFKTFEREDGQIGIEVMYQNERRQFDPVLVAGMILGKLRDIAAKATERACKDVVLSVPGYWTHRQRRALLDATRVAGLNCLRLLNDHTASALQYGIYKTNLSETDPIYTMFVDMGYSNTTVSVVEFLKGKLRVVSAVYDRHLGGRDFDQVLVDHFAREFKEKYKIDVTTNERAMIRMKVACEKLKKVLNTVNEAPINIDCLMNDIDVKGHMKRPDYDVMCAPLLARLAPLVEQALADSGLTAEKLFAVEITGGGTRLMSVQGKLAEVVKRDLSRTLNHEESVSRGCALQCAMLSPIFRVREFSVTDLSPYPVRLTWTKSSSDPNADTSVEVFTRNNPLPSSKMVTLIRNEPLEIQVEYVPNEFLPQGTPLKLGTIVVPNIPAPGANAKPNEVPKIRVKVRLDIHGIISTESAQMVETLEEVAPVAPTTATPAEGQPQEAAPVDGQPTTAEQPAAANANAAKAEEPKKKKVRRTDLPFQEQLEGLTLQQLQSYAENEANMAAADRLAIETAEKKNAVETYVYDTRGKLGDSLAPFTTEQESAKFSKLLEDTENWLYEEGADQTKSVYVQKLDELKALGNPIYRRKYEYENRYESVNELRKAIEGFRMAATFEDPKYEHIEKQEKDKIVAACAGDEKWLNENLSKQDSLPKHVDPVISVVDILKRKQELERLATSILNKPKPAPPKPAPTPAAAEEKKAGDQQPAQDVPMTDAQQSQQPQQEQQPAAASQEPSAAKPAEMELD